MPLKKWVRDTYGDHRVRRVKALRTQIAGRFDVGPWRRPGLYGLDVQLANIFGWTKNGTFMELGGNDGLQYSNSFMLERELGWRGILIEAIPELAAEAVRNRPKATVVCAAVTSTSKCGVVAMDDEDLVSKISSTHGPLWVATTTLSNIIDTVAKSESPDFLTIDVEGFEMDVLGGLDLTRHRPKWMLVETQRKDDVSNVLKDYYKFEAQLSYHDYLYTLNE